MMKCQKDPTCGIFLKRGLFKDIKNGIPMSQICKYKKTKEKKAYKAERLPNQIVVIVMNHTVVHVRVITSAYAVFVYLCICIFVFLYLHV